MSYSQFINPFFSCPEQLNRWPCHSVTDWLTHSLTQGTLLIDIQRATQETCDLWDLWLEWWGDMNWPKKKTMTGTKTKTKTMTETNTFRKHLQRATLETCDLWDIRSEWWGDMTWPKKYNDNDKYKDKGNYKDNDIDKPRDLWHLRH